MLYSTLNDEEPVFAISSVCPFKRRKATAEKHSMKGHSYYFEGKNKDTA
jgi:hypothetical protein